MLNLSHPSIFHHHRRKSIEIEAKVNIAIIFIITFFTGCLTAPEAIGTASAIRLSAATENDTPIAAASSSLPFEEALRHVALQRVTEPTQVVNLTRQHGGDVFTAHGK